MCSLQRILGSKLRLRILIGALTGLWLSVPARKACAQAFSFTNANLLYNENFNGMGTNGTGFIAGWTSNDPSMLASDGSSGTGSIYNVGTGGAIDRAFGSLADGNTPLPFLFFGASFLNSSGQTVSAIDLAGGMEQWRTGASAGVIERNAFEYSLNATSVSTGTWTALPAFDLVEKLTSSVTAATTDGNLAANQTAISAHEDLNWVTGTRLWIRWGDANDVSLDGLYAIDDFSLAVTLTPSELVWNGGTGIWDTSTANWLVGGVPAVFSDLGNVSFTDAGLVSGSTVTVVAGGVTAGTVNVSNTTGTYRFDGGAINGSRTLAKSGAGTLVLATTYGGAIVVTGGTLRTGASEVFANAQPISLSSGSVLNLAGNNETVGALTLTGASVTTGGGTLILGGDATIASSASSAVLSGTISVGGASRIVNVANGAASEDLVMSASLSGLGTLTFTGAGTIQLNADNAGFGGDLRFNGLGQTVILANSKALGSGLAEFSGSSLSAAFALTGANKVTTPIRVGANGVTIEIGNIELGGTISFVPGGLLRLPVNTTAILSGFLDTTAANATVQKTGAGTLRLIGSGAGSGRFQIDNGTVELASQSALGTGAVSVSGGVSGGKLVVNGSLATSGGVEISGGGALLGGSGQIALPSNGAVTMGADARISPGSSAGLAGQLTMLGQPQAAPRGTFLSDRTVWVFDMNPGLPGGSAEPGNLNGFDRISVVGNVVLLAPTLTLTSVRFESQVNDLFFILLNDGSEPIFGTFAGLPQGASLATSNPVVTFTISYTGDSATNSPTGGNDIALVVTRGPEPHSLLFTLLGCGLLGARRPQREPRVIERST